MQCIKHLPPKASVFPPYLAMTMSQVFHFKDKILVTLLIQATVSWTMSESVFTQLFSNIFAQFTYLSVLTFAGGRECEELLAIP